VQLVDVRTPAEYAEEHLAGAVNIDYNAADFKTKIDALNKSNPTMIYCLSGGRSASAMSYMSESGFKEVYNMKGGMLQWRAAKLPTNVNKQAAEWKGMTTEEYRQLISGDIPVVIDFNAKWCGPCKQLKPILDEIQQEYAGKIKIIPIDIDVNKSLAQSMFVNNIPLLVYHEKGQVILNQEGFLDKQGLVKLFRLAN
jgi:thioredoxin